MLTFLQFGQYSGLLALALETSQRVLEALFFSYVHDRHCSLTSLWLPTSRPKDRRQKDL